NGIGVLSGNGDGTFGVAQKTAFTADGGSVAVADFNLDGTPDLTYTGAGNTYITLQQPLTGALTINATPAVDHFVFSAPGSALAGTSITLTVTAQDAANNPFAGYTGTITFSSTDSQAILPANATLTNGVGTFSVTLKTAGSKTVTVADTVTSTISGTSAIEVSAA